MKNHVNRMADVEEMTDVAKDVVRKLVAGSMTPKMSNAICGAAQTVLLGVRTERLLLRDMAPAIPATPGRKRLPPAATAALPKRKTG